MRVELVKIGFQKQFMVVHQIKSLIYILYDTSIESKVMQWLDLQFSSLSIMNNIFLILPNKAV